MHRLLLTVTAILSSSAISFANVVVIPDTPNAGDTTTITTVTSGNPVTTNNLISQNWIDGSWEGTMFPDSSDITESIYLTGKHDKYAETTINSEDYVTLEEFKLGFSSNFDADIRWWNPTESTVTMYQTATNGVDTITQSTTFEDTTNHNYQFNNYGNTLIMNADPNMTHGTLTAGFSFDILGNKNYNGGHAGVDVKDPTLTVNYQTLSSTTVTTIEYCWQKVPSTCPATEEIAIVEDIIQGIDTIVEDITMPEELFAIEYMPIDYTWDDDLIVDEIIIEEELEVFTVDNFFFETEYMDDDYYEEVVLDEFIPDDIVMDQAIDWNDSNVEVFDELPVVEDYYAAEEVVMEEMFEEVFEEFIEEAPIEIIEEVVMEEAEPIEMAEVTETPIEEISNDIQEEEKEEIKEEIVETEPEETIEEEQQPAKSKEVVAETKEVVEDPIEQKAEVTEEEKPEVSVDVKIAQIEKVIQEKVKNTTDQVNITLTAVNEIVSREMAAQQPDMSGYMAMNASFFDDRQLPKGNQNFFKQMNLTGYDYNIYENNNTIVAMVGQDPVVQHQIKMQEINNRKQDAYKNLMEALNARNIQ